GGAGRSAAAHVRQGATSARRAEAELHADARVDADQERVPVTDRGAGAGPRAPILVEVVLDADPHPRRRRDQRLDPQEEAGVEPGLPGLLAGVGAIEEVRRDEPAGA